MNNIYDLINTFFERENETSDGARGNAFEKACKVYFGLQTIETARVSPRGRKDFTKYVDGKRCCFEAKTGSGSYGYMFDGKFKNELDGNKYVIYWATLTSPIYVVPMVDFNREVQANFTRQPKYSTIEHRRGNDSKNVYSIKTINDGTSHKERDRINTMCELYGETLEDFILNHEIKMA